MLIHFKYYAFCKSLINLYLSFLIYLLKTKNMSQLIVLTIEKMKLFDLGHSQKEIIFSQKYCTPINKRILK